MEDVIIPQVPIENLHPSPFNPRSVLPNMDEMITSVMSKGIREMLLVRPRELAGSTQTIYEVVDGHRRLEAAKKTGISFISVLLRDMTDEEVKEEQLVRALQREGLHPYDEAKHIDDLLKSNNGEYVAVAAKLGKPEKYIRRRHQLIKLTKSAAELFAAGNMPVEVAFQLSRLQPDFQNELVKAGKKNKFDWRFVDGTIRNSMQEVSKFPWSLTDPTLYPQAGPCTTCPKNSAAQTLLFDGDETARCTDPACSMKKMGLHFERIKAANPDIVQIAGDYFDHGKDVILTGDYTVLKDKTEKCDDTKPVVFVGGESNGREAVACVNPKCKVHRGLKQTETRAPVRTETEKTPEEKAERKKELRAEKIRKIVAESMALKTISAVSPLNTKALRLIVGNFWDALWHDKKKRVCDVLKLEPAKSNGGKDYDAPMVKRIASADGSDLMQLGLLFAISDIFNPQLADAKIKELAALFKVDTKAIYKTATESVDRKEKAGKEAKADKQFVRRAVKKTKSVGRKPSGKPKKRKPEARA